MQLTLINSPTKNLLKGLIKKIIALIPLKLCLKLQYILLKRLEKVVPQYVYLPLLDELYAALIRENSQKLSQQYQDAKNLLVNLGSGATGKPGWVNVDLFAAPGVNCVYDCRKSLPFANSSVQGIFSEHFFEHIDYVEEVPDFLAECHRVLQPGGVLRIIVPDIEKYLQAYCRQGWEVLSKIRPLDSDRTDFYFNHKYNTKLELINFVFRQGYEHKYAYDFATLEFLLYKYGFSKVQKQEFGKSMMDKLCLDQQIRTSESLYIEAVK
jgi:predicted SAM-dependent methyltransferase